MYFFFLQQVHYVIYCTFYLIRSVTMAHGATVDKYKFGSLQIMHLS